MIPADISDRSRERQSAALSEAEKRVKRTRTQIAADLALSYDQYGRYVSGATPLRVEQIEQFAAVYGVDPGVLGHAILSGDISELTDADPSPAYDFLAELRRVLPHDPHRADRTYAEWEWAPESVQRAIVDAFERLGPGEHYKIRPTGT